MAIAVNENIFDAYRCMSVSLEPGIRFKKVISAGVEPEHSSAVLTKLDYPEVLRQWGSNPQSTELRPFFDKRLYSLIGKKIV